LFLALIAGSLLCSAVVARAATITVTSTGDSGKGTLRQAILDAKAGDTINFSLPGNSAITLTSAELMIDKGLTISGPGANLLTVRRNTAAGTPRFRIFEIPFAGVNFDVTISGLTITNGSAASDADGGAISYTSAGNTLTVRGCIISGNVAAGNGGAIWESSGKVSIINSTISGNSAVSGGGIYGNNGTISVTNSTFSTNSATGGGGGGVLIHFGNMSVDSSTFSANSAAGEGGGIFCHSGGLMISDSTISGNSADHGGGVVTDDGSETTLTDTTISANSARLVGGIDISQGDGTIVSNTIIAKNTDKTGDPDFKGNLASQGYNLIGNDSGGGITATTGDQIGTAASPIDPLLGPLQNNGGPTQTQALLPGSPAIDKGNTGSDPTTDQRGLLRPVDDPAIPNATGGQGSDIGAFEVQAPGSLLNISTRMRVLTGEHALIAGFIVTENDPKKATDPKTVLVRGLGPSLAVSGSLADPTLELHDVSTIIATNNNWQDTQKAAIEATMIPPHNPLESAILITLPARKANYTAILRGKADATGIGLVEVYDLAQGANSKLANISTRGFVDTGDNVMIGGFIIGPVQSGGVRVIVRAIGPSLKSSGITNPLANPTLELHDGNGGVIGFNDNWRSDQEAEIKATTIPPSNDLESAIVRTLSPGNYTAIVRGVNNTTGVALVEVYALN
jgi:hypothetical protein